MRVLSDSIPVELDSTCSNRACPTCVSTAERGSSRRYTSASTMMALARLTRCCCPPLSVIPLSPISVWSPAGSSSKSLSRHATFNAF
mmetsp:Transcript_191/g.228  ORF Transcript_191/g.228 Transcript_191/m.228 type:complete len:87 (-) Transcript_191:97-357(-)